MGAKVSALRDQLGIAHSRGLAGLTLTWNGLGAPFKFDQAIKSEKIDGEDEKRWFLGPKFNEAVEIVGGLG